MEICEKIVRCVAFDNTRHFAGNCGANMTRFLALTLLIGFFAFLPSAFADGESGLHITPADTHQTASSGSAMLTLKASNIQVRAKWRLDGDSPFAITDNGELRLTAILSDPDTIVATVIVEDMFSELNRNYQNLAATAFITVEFISHTLTATVEMSEPLILADAPPLTATVINATVSLHTFTASGGLGTLTYALIGNNTLHFSIDERGGILRIDETATVGIYTLSVEVSDGAITPQKATAIATVAVEMLEPLILADAPPLTATVINATVSLHTFTANGGLGTKTYALIMGNADYFSIGDNSGVLQMNSGAVEGIYTLSVEISDGAITPQKATAVATVTVEMLEPLILADAPPLTVTVINATVSLHTFTASGGLGTLTYALIGDHTLHFSIDERDGVLRIDETATMGIYTLSVEVSDGAITPATAVATVAVEMLEPLILADAPPLTATVINATVSLHTFTASGGLGTLTYALIGDHTLHFSIDERNGVLRIDETATMGIYTLSVEVADGAITPQKATAVATVTVEMLEPLILADAPPLTATVINATVSLHTFTASGGLGTLTYALIGDNTLHFSIDERGGVLRIDETATVGIYTLSVEVADGVITPQKATAVATVTVEMLEPLILADAPPLTATVINATVSLHTFTASGGLGTLTYALIGDNTLHFSIDERGGVLRIDETATVGIYTLSVEVSDKVIIPQRATAMATVAVVATVAIEIEGIKLNTLTLKAKVSDRARDLHAFAPYASAYSIVAGNDDGYFAIGEASGTLSVQAWTPAGNYPLGIGITYTFSLGIPPRVVVSSVVVEITDYPTPAQRKIYVLGGYDGSNRLNDVWSSVNGTNWSLETSSAAWPRRLSHQALSHNGKIYVLGGSGNYDHENGSSYKNDVWSSVNGTNWSLETSSAAWPRRYSHQALSHNGKIYVLGGSGNYDHENGSSYKNDVWSSVNGTNWSLETSSAAWPRRDDHQALSHNGRLYVLGGRDGPSSSFNRLNDVWSSADGKNWLRETANAGWYRRSGHQALSHNGRLYVLGGYNYNNSDLNDVWSSAEGKNWLRETYGTRWSRRYSHQALSHNGKIYVLGGSDGSNRLNDVWSSVNGTNWSLETSSAAWPRRYSHQAVVFPSPLVLFGVGEKITMTAGVAADNLHTFTAQYGKGNYTYSLEPAVDGFAVSGNGVLSEDGTAMADAYTLSVFVADEEDNIAQTAIRVNVIRLSLSFLDASEEWTLPFGHAGVLNTLTASGGYGDYTYTLSPPGSGFVIDANGVLSADGTATPGEHTITVEVADEINSKTATWTGKVIIISAALQKSSKITPLTLLPALPPLWHKISQ